MRAGQTDQGFWSLTRAAPLLPTAGGLVATYRDVTASRRQEFLLSGSRSALARLARTLRQDVLTDRVESRSAHGALASILLLELSGRHFVHCSAPSLPRDYSEALDGEGSARPSGPCGTAAHVATQVIVEDMQTDSVAEYAEARGRSGGHAHGRGVRLLERRVVDRAGSLGPARRRQALPDRWRADRRAPLVRRAELGVAARQGLLGPASGLLSPRQRAPSRRTASSSPTKVRTTGQVTCTRGTQRCTT